MHLKLKRIKRVHVFIMVLLAVVIIGIGFQGTRQVVKRGGKSELVEVLVNQTTGEKSNKEVKGEPKSEIFDTAEGKIYRNNELKYQLSFPRTWNLNDADLKHVELIHLNNQDIMSDWMVIENREKKPEMDLLDWINISGEILPFNQESVEIEGGKGIRFLSYTGMYATAINYFGRTAGGNNRVYKITCTTTGFLREEHDCFKIIKTFTFTD